jgi:glycosyltransferase involved in cell wall biosynthesis
MALPRAVFVAPIAPAREGNGLAMRMGLFLEALCRISEVDVILAPVAGSAISPEASRFLHELGVRLHRISITGAVDTHFSLLTRLPDSRARLEAFRAYGKPSLASALSSPVLGSIEQIIRSCAPQIVHVGRSYLAASVAALPPKAIATLDLDEDDLTSFASQAALARKKGNAIAADWLEQEGLACDAMVSRFGARFQRMFVASAREALLLAKRHGAFHFVRMENAVEIPPRVVRRDDGATLLFVGSLGYEPNAEGVLWVAQEALPRLRAVRGGAVRLLIAGAQPPRAVSALARHPGVFVLGRAPDVLPLYQRATLALAPLRAGGGTRIKLLEAAAHRVASVYSPAAAEGIGWPKGAGGWSASSAREFAAACHEGLSQGAERARRVKLAQEWLLRHHARSRLVTRISHAFQSLLDEGSGEGNSPSKCTGAPP